jgi:hypothetical protein
MTSLKFGVAFVLGFAAAYFYEIITFIIGRQILATDNPGLIIYGYRLHHSLYGLLFLVFWAKHRKEFYLGFGLGIIVQHTMFGGFQFISKEII